MTSVAFFDMQDFDSLSLKLHYEHGKFIIIN